MTLIRYRSDLTEQDVTPPDIYHDRRRFMRGTAGLIGGALASALLPGRGLAQTAAAGNAASPFPPYRKAAPAEDALTSLKDATSYNNYIEFGPDKTDPAQRASGKLLRHTPWTVRIDGLCAKPQTIDVDSLIRRAPLEERIYRLRCVETWSMVLPWIGFPLGWLLDQAEPLGSARYVAFETLLDPDALPEQRHSLYYRWPYQEGLRLDEARHPLSLLAVGLYGQILPEQNGYPLRLVVPWKYGFKSIKSITSIRLTDSQPKTLWSSYAPQEYGFYANVNPAVDHPRWSQAKERRIGEFRKRETLPFNGYGEQVAGLYTGLNLRENF